MIVARVSVAGIPEVAALLMRAAPARSTSIIRNALRSSALRVAAVAQQESIIRGGRRMAGGKMTSSRPHPTRLTSRTGAGRGSIGVDFQHAENGIATISSQTDPASVRVGSHLGYMALHERGGSILVPGAIVRSHTRRNAFGKHVKAFIVPQHYRSAHGATYPARPWLAPALDKVRAEIPGIFLREWLRAVAGP